MLVVVPMTGTGSARINDRTSTEALNRFFRTARGTPDNVDPVTVQDADRPFTYATRDHMCYTHPREHPCNVRLAAAALGRIDLFFARDLLALIQRIDNEMLAVAEVLVHHSFACGNRNLHNAISFLVHDDLSSFNAEELSVDDHIRNLAASRLDDAPECLA